jgi:pimeloyl-ACP methyl ester carboxylesterase
MAMEAWIDELPPVALPDERWIGRTLTRLGTALDGAALRAAQLAVNAMLIRTSEDLDALRASAEMVLDEEYRRDPARFFSFRDERLPSIETSIRYQRPIDGGIAIGRAFASDYRALTREGEGGGARSAIDDPILIEHWTRAVGDPRGTIVALHGFGMGQPRLGAITLFAGQWFRRGLDVALLTLPSHGERTPADARFSGECFAIPHISRLAEAVRQAIHEIHLVTLWLRERTPAPVGMLGMSLGGYLASLMAGLYGDLDFVVPMAPPVCMGDLAWRFLTKNRHHRRGSPTAFSQRELRASFRIHSPLAHALQVPRERVLIVAGRGDRIVPPEHPNALWRHWGEPNIFWFSGSHLAPSARPRIVRAIVHHLEDLEIL